MAHLFKMNVSLVFLLLQHMTSLYEVMTFVQIVVVDFGILSIIVTKIGMLYAQKFNVNEKLIDR